METRYSMQWTREEQARSARVAERDNVRRLFDAAMSASMEFSEALNKYEQKYFEED